MWIEKLPSGKYRAVERYKDPVTGKQKKVSTIITKDTQSERKAAQRILDEKIEDALGGRSEDYTLQQVVDLYLEDLQASIKPSTMCMYQMRTKSLVRIIGSDVIAERLTAPYVMSRLRADSTTPSTVNGRIRALRMIIRWAFRNDIVKNTSWLDKLQPMKDDKRARIEDKYLEPDELIALLESMEDSQERLLTQLLALSGLRIGEALALTMADIDDRYIHVTKTLSVGAGILSDTPKTADSFRDVYIQPELADCIAAIRKERLHRQLTSGIRTDSLFIGIKYDTYHHHISKTSSTIGHRITPHALRHTHVSLLAAQDVPYDAIARRLGHKGDKITRDIYAHVTTRLKEQDEQRMEQVRLL